MNPMDEAMRQRVLITGSSGMLGCDLSSELRKSYEVWGSDLVARNAGYVTRSQGHKVTRFYECDVTDKKSVDNIVEKIRPDIVIHAAAWTDVDGCERDHKRAYRINNDGTKNVALACKKNGALLVYISTDFVFNGRKKDPYKESDKTAPLGVYADSKLRGEAAVSKLVPRHYIVRTSWLYGRCGKNFVDTIIAKAEAEPVLRVVDDQVGSPTYTKDLARAIHALLNKVTRSQGHKVTSLKFCGIYHISNAGAVSWYKYAKTILRIENLKTKVVPISSKELARPAARPAMSVLDCSKFTKFTGFRMRNWKSALKEYLRK